MCLNGFYLIFNFFPFEYTLNIMEMCIFSVLSYFLIELKVTDIDILQFHKIKITLMNNI